MAKFTWQDGTLVSKAKVEIDGTIYEVDPEEYSGATPLSASNLNAMQDGIYEDIDEAKEKIDNMAEYSTTEQVVGKWIDNKPLYRKVILMNTVTAGTTGTVDLSSLNIDEVWVDVSNSFFKSENISLPINRTHTAIMSNQTEVRVTPAVLSLTCGTGISAVTPVVTIKYTKTTD